MTGPDFGPGGYLPPKAAKRARKIVLREQMGRGWPLAAVAAAVVVAVTGVVFLRVWNSPPRAPFVAVGDVADVDPSGAAVLDAEGAGAIVIRAGGAIRAFRLDREGTAWCPQSSRLETDDAAWTRDGRVVFGGEDSLTPLRSVVFDGVVYVDPTSAAEPPPPAPRGAPPVCGGRSR
ncbi:MAG: hypothetical protein GEU74_02200 [Nitriliruptorales bacterium]|nr:hypothetical protein [Nitriliruptorales bacterium]